MGLRIFMLSSSQLMKCLSLKQSSRALLHERLTHISTGYATTIADSIHIPIPSESNVRFPLILSLLSTIENSPMCYAYRYDRHYELRLTGPCRLTILYAS
jgi:hypothetical protein